MSEQASERPLAPGSTWRRWDPHVHLPGTLFNDQFGDMSITAALDDLAAREPRIEAVGITDYFTTATYREAVAAHQAGAGEGIEFLFPNVELRLDVQTGGGSGVNVHLMCAPEDVDWGGSSSCIEISPSVRTLKDFATSDGRFERSPL